MAEASDVLDAQGVAVDTLRVRAFPFTDEVERFIAEHDTVFVVEQNRDAQLRSMIVNELEIDPAKLVPILHYDGTPITARFIVAEVGSRASGANVQPIARGKKAAA
jgi:2-oxoglutarate ferredoxin oxidoreductase subunit alpha